MPRLSHYVLYLLPPEAYSLLCAYLVGLVGFMLSTFRTKDEKTLQEKDRALLHRL